MKTRKKTIEERDALRTILLLAACFYPIPFAFAVTWLEMKDYSIRNRRLIYFGLGACTVSVWMLIDTLVSSFLSETGKVSSILFMLDVLILPGGIYLLVLYGILMRRNRRIQKCLMLIQKEHITLISRIGEILGLSDTEIRTLLNFMIQKNLLEGASLSENDDEIAFSRSVWAKQHVVCDSCGAELVVNLGEALICEYCGSVLKARRICSEY